MTPTVLVTLTVVHWAPVLIDMSRLVGEWRGEGQFGRGTLVFAPNGACVERSAGRLRAATYWVEPSKRPAAIDFWDPGAEAPRRGIYKISGDTLTVCWAEDRGDARPAGFEASGVGTGTDILHLTRVLRAAPPAGGEDAARPAPWANKLFTGRPAAPPPVVVQDAGILPKGGNKTVRVKIANIYAVHLQVQRPKPVSERVPCTVVRWPDRLDPKQVGFVEVEIDTRGLDGEYSVRVPVAVFGVDPKGGQPFTSCADMVIRFVSR